MNLALLFVLLMQQPEPPMFLGGTIRTQLTVVQPDILQCESGMFCQMQLTTAEVQNGPVEWVATGLPDGMDIFPDGTVCGTPTCDGQDVCSFTATITATEVRGIFDE